MQSNHVVPAPRGNDDRSSTETGILTPPSARLLDFMRPGCPGMAGLSEPMMRTLAAQGYAPMAPVFGAGCDDAFIEEVARLIAAGRIPASPDRIVDGEITEWVVNLGTVWGKPLGGEWLASAPLLRALMKSLVTWADDYNALRPLLLAQGVRPEEAPEIAPEGLELNVNKVVGTRRAVWSGLHPHRDMRRFNDALVALDEQSVRHAAIRARALTFSAYFRPLDAEGRRREDAGGALSFQLRAGMRQPGDRAIWDCVLAQHNVGTVFFPHTVHGVARMVPDSVRYSFQVFFPGREAWEGEIQPRIASGELADELAVASRRGRIGWR